MLLHQDELDYKQQQLASAAATGEALKSELAARKAELDKIDTLGSKIDLELEALRGRLAAMQQELDTYGAVEAAKAAKEATRAQLEAEKAQLAAKQDAVKVSGMRSVVCRWRDFFQHGGCKPF